MIFCVGDTVYLICSYLFVLLTFILFFFFFKQKTAYEMHISDWSSDVCSSDLLGMTLTIGELGKATGTKVETVRYYERIGLLPRPAQIGRASCRERVCQYV